MPETRYVEEYDNDGNVINRIPYVVSDEELYMEAREKGSNDASHRIRDNFDDWDTLSNTAKREALKDALECLITLLKDRY